MENLRTSCGCERISDYTYLGKVFVPGFRYAVCRPFKNRRSGAVQPPRLLLAHVQDTHRPEARLSSPVHPRITANQSAEGAQALARPAPV